jgi:hypothetical protein
MTPLRAGLAGAAVLAALLVAARACTEEPARGPADLRGRSGGAGEPAWTGPGGYAPEAPLPPGALEEAERYDMPPGLDHKGVQAWNEVANAVHEGKPHKALDKMNKFERRFGESPESSRLRRTLEEWARREGPHDD